MNSLLNRQSPGLCLCGLLAAVCFINILFMPRQIFPGDPTVWREETRNLLLHGHLWVDPSLVNLGEPGQYFVLNQANGRFYSKYGIANSLMAIPPMALDLWLSHGRPGSVRQFCVIYSAWDTLLSMALAATLLVICRRYCNNPLLCAAYVLACFYATFVWSYLRSQSGEIYQALFFALFFECMLRGAKHRGWLAVAWGCIALLVLTRPVFGLLVPIFAMLCCFQGRLLRSTAPLTLVGAAAVLLAFGAVNAIKFGSPWITGYSQWRPQEHLPTGSLLDGAWGFLFTTRWSIFVGFPLLFLAAPNYRRFAIAHRFDALAILAIFLVSLVVLGKIPTWRGGASYGPRYLLFALPILAMPAVLGGGRLWKSAAICFLLFSVWLQFEVISAKYGFFYLVQSPLEGRMDSETAEYFEEHPDGVIIHDLYANGLNSQLLAHERSQLSPDEFADYCNTVSATLRDTNLFWWPPR